MQSGVIIMTNKRVTSIMMMHCNYHSIYSEENTTAAGHDQSPLAGKPDSSPTRGRSVSSTADPASSFSYDRDSSDQQLTPRRRLDTTGGTPYDLKFNRNEIAMMICRIFLQDGIQLRLVIVAIIAIVQ